MASLKEMIQSAVGVSHAIITYRAKKTQELSRYKVTLGVDIAALYALDLIFLNTMLATATGVDRDAVQQIIASKELSLRVGVGNNPAYTCKDTYLYLADGLKQHADTGAYYASGLITEKTVIEKAKIPFKPPVSSIAIAKAAVNKNLPSGRWRMFDLDFAMDSSISGEFLVVNCG